jgi:hypothetical protein
MYDITFDITLTYEEIDKLKSILLDDIEKDGYDTPDYADPTLMEEFTNRAVILQKVIHLMSCRDNSRNLPYIPAKEKTNET